MFSWVNACTVRTAFSVSSANAPTSARRSWLARDSRRTRRPKITIGKTTRGTIRIVSPASLGLVMTSITMPPKNKSAFLSAIEALDPTTVWMRVVSVVSRDSTSPVRVTSKKTGLRPMTWR